LPAAQVEHTSAPDSTARPGAHGSQAVAPLADTDPAAQAVHAVSPSWSPYLPAAHTTHELTLAYLPAAHTVHTAAPAPDTEPLAHAEQTVRPGESLNLPATHVAHTELPLTPYLPAGQSVHAEAPLATTWPGAHALHALLPAAEKALTGQVWQTLAVNAAENFPPAHMSQVDIPVRLAYCPGKHAKQAAYW
jgi:hypothetical protein